jgi:VWFA-related protein
MDPGARRVAATLLACVLPAGAQEVPRDFPPIVRGGAELVMVDVAVVDGEGRPVRDLTLADFVLREEGQVQPITHFESVRVEERSSVSADRPPVSTNTERPSAAPSSLLAIVFDERHLRPETLPSARAAVDGLLAKGLTAGDEVILLATGQGYLWNARNEIGLAALRARLPELRGLRRLPVEHEQITEWEAYRIALFEDRQALHRVMGRIGDVERARGGLVTSRGAAASSRTDSYERMARGLGRQVWSDVSQRSNATLANLEGLAQALGPRKGRKTAVLITEGFVADQQSNEWKRTLDAARRSHLTIYGLDARGLQLDGGRGADVGRKAVFLGNDGTGLMDFEASEGSDRLVDETGGTVRRYTNRLDDALLQISAEGRNYYLLGYQPVVAADDKYRRLKVEVLRPGLTVHARKGYYARRTPAPAAGSVPVPLRLTAYVREPRPQGRTHVQVVGEIDPAAIQFKREGDRWTAALDWVADLFTPGQEAPPAKTLRLRLSLTEAALAAARQAWIPVGADFEVPAGTHVARLFVRDEAGGRTGAVDHVFAVAPSGALYLATVISDMQRAAGSRAPALIARRTFKAGTRLLCQVEVNNAAGAPGSRRVMAGHELRTAAGDVLERQEPTLMAEVADGRLARLLVMSLERPPGRYELVLRVRDETSGASVESVEPFEVVAAE